MTEIAGCVSLSHSPFYNFVVPESPGDPGYHFTQAVELLRSAVAELRVDAMVVFGPDHFRNIFYDCMPAFCLGMERLTAFGDYGTPSGHLALPQQLARDVLISVQGSGFDPAFSLSMGIDHGISQVYANLRPELDIPLLPIMVNTSAPPLPPLRRCFDFGACVGRAIHSSSFGGRVLVVGSGGLSHWPPKTSADDPGVDPSFREFLITGRDRVTDMEPGREQVVRDMGATADGRVNQAWDREFLDHLRSDLSYLTRMADEDIEEIAGNGGQEVRTWAAAVAAWGRPLVWTDYEPVPRWITGMGCAASFVP